METTKKHGGARSGAGRKKTVKQTSFHLDLDLVPILQYIPNKSRFINEAIREKLEIKKHNKIEE